MHELDLWKASSVNIDTDKGPLYRDTGGHRSLAHSDSIVNAYALSDLGRWLARKPERVKADILAGLMLLYAVAATAILAVQTLPPPASRMTVEGNVANPLSLGVEDLARMPVQVVEDVRQVRVDGTPAIDADHGRRYRGVLLRDLLAAARPVEKERPDLRQSIVIATSTDGYGAVFSWAELVCHRSATVHSSSSSAMVLRWPQPWDPWHLSPCAIRSRQRATSSSKIEIRRAGN